MKRFTTIIAVCFLALTITTGCIPEGKGQNQQAAQNQKKQASVQDLMAKQGTAQLDFSMDRYLLKERLERFNDPNKMSYLYVFTPAGPVIQVTIQGKVASTSKRLTMPVQKYKLDKGPHYEQVLGPAPDEMGVYGPSGGGAKVGMTTLGSLLEFGGFGFYMYSEVPLSFSGLDAPVIEVVIQADETDRAALQQRLDAVKTMKK